MTRLRQSLLSVSVFLFASTAVACQDAKCFKETSDKYLRQAKAKEVSMASQESKAAQTMVLEQATVYAWRESAAIFEQIAKAYDNCRGEAGRTGFQEVTQLLGKMRFNTEPLADLSKRYIASAKSRLDQAFRDCGK
ncbi:MAG: hypothetical protein HQL56_13415 [Magnetococcales bacterium]|nr:hypothetical protein [Magnetococcales bacterium]